MKLNGTITKGAGLQGRIGLGGGTSIVVDKELSTTSTNPVENRVVAQAIEGLSADMYGESAPGKNKLNPQTITVGRRVGDNGVISNNANYSISEKIMIPSGATHVVASYLNSQGTQSVPAKNMNVGFYLEDGTPLGAAIGEGDIPSDAVYVVWSASHSYPAERCMLEFSEAMTAFEPYMLDEGGGIKQAVADHSEKISVLEKSVSVTTIEVGSGYKYTSLVSAIDSITDSSEHNRYVIELHEGEYETIVADRIDSNYKGMTIPNHVSIIGIGDRNNIIIKGNLPSADYAQYANEISTLHLCTNGTVENVTVTSKNIRYCNHDDGTEVTVPGGMIKSSHTFRNVKFIVYQNDEGITTAGHNIGIGAMADKEIVFESCEFITHRGAYGVMIHDNASDTQLRGARLKIDRCKFVNDVSYTPSVCLSNSGNTMESYAEITNTVLAKGGVRFTTSGNVAHNCWKLFACGNQNYAINQSGNLEGADLSEYITAFNNA